MKINRTKLFWFAMLTLPFLAIVAFGEGAVRIYYLVRYGDRPLTVDDYLGWRPTENLRFKTVKKDLSGKTYPVDFQTNGHGFRMVGVPNPDPERPRVLFIGDSFTHALEVSNDNTYYAVVGRSLPIEVFAIGCGGYGTLQEYLTLDRYIDEIKPHVVIIQSCHNDFINNVYELELKSDTHNNGMRRPYLNPQGEITYGVPSAFPWIRHAANKYSRLFYFIFSRLDRYSRPRMAESSEKLIAEKGRAFPPFNGSFEITERILKMIRDRAGPHTAVYVFSVDRVSPYHETLMEAAESAGVQFIPGVPEAIREAEQKGLITKCEGGIHWNETGHRIAAEQLIKRISVDGNCTRTCS